MKRITVRCPLVLNMGSQQFEFKPAQSYEVEDAVAAHPYLQAHLATYTTSRRRRKKSWLRLRNRPRKRLSR